MAITLKMPATHHKKTRRDDSAGQNPFQGEVEGTVQPCLGLLPTHKVRDFSKYLLREIQKYFGIFTVLPNFFL